MRILRIFYLGFVTYHIASADEPAENQNTTTANTTSPILATPAGNITNITTNLHCINNYGECLKSNVSCVSKRARVSGICDDSNEDCCVATLDERNTWKKKDGECLEKFGECTLETHTCKGTFENSTCGGTKHRICCVPSAEEMSSWTENDKVCQKSMGTCTNKIETCKGTYQADTCGGPAQRQCCLPEPEVRKKWEEEDGKCQEVWGTCQFKLDECSGKYEAGFCGGPEQRRCCVPDEAVKTQWKKEDNKCLLKFGVCQHNTENCTGSYEGEKENLCGGPKYRQCCIPDSKNVTKWHDDDEPCSKKGGVCQSIGKNCESDYLSDLCGGPRDIRKCCLSPVEESSDNTKEDKSNNDKSTPPKHKTSKERRIMVLSVSIPVLIVLLIVLICMIKRRGRCCKPHRALRGDPKKMPWYKMEYNELEEDDEGVNLTSMEDSPSYA